VHWSVIWPDAKSGREKKSYFFHTLILEIKFVMMTKHIITEEDRKEVDELHSRISCKKRRLYVVMQGKLVYVEIKPLMQYFSTWVP